MTFRALEAIQLCFLHKSGYVLVDLLFFVDHTNIEFSWQAFNQTKQVGSKKTIKQQQMNARYKIRCA
jgi:hypothetical protein